MYLKGDLKATNAIPNKVETNERGGGRVGDGSGW